MNVVVGELPTSLAAMQSMAIADLSSPERTAALAIAALAVYSDDAAAAVEMIDWLKGPDALSVFEKQFLRDRVMDGVDYVARSYFAGATPANNYEPSRPYEVAVEENQYSYDTEGYARLWLKSGGADNPREITLRQKKSTGQWFLVSYQGLLAGIRVPESQDPWT